MPRSRAAPRSLLVLVLAATAGLVAADPNDWVNVNYVVKQANAGDTSLARQKIISKASSSANSGPWSVTHKNNVKPPSGDVQDYLSWAPYHWPECNWCGKGTVHLSGFGSGGNCTDDGGSDEDDGSNDEDDFYEDGGIDGPEGVALAVTHGGLFPRASAFDGGSHYHGTVRHRMLRRRRRIQGQQRTSNHAEVRRQDDDVPLWDSCGADLPDPPDAVPSAPKDGLSVPPTDGVPTSLSIPTTGLPTSVTGSPSSTVKTINGTPAPAQAPAKTSKAGKCTPSPSKSLPPSATWTTCPYEVRDGKVNPDVRTLPDSPAAVDMAQAVLYNAVAYAMQNTATFSKNAATFIETFFTAPSTGMNPNMNFGQQVRGPGKDHQMGTFTGILDMRGFVKVVNGIQLLKAAGSPDWTSARDKAMTSWAKSYITWLQNSAIGKDTASKANNHLSFYVNQLAAAQMLVGDTNGAQTTLKNYFAQQFMDQIAASGEQPFEAVRTRPYHYRCFNLEAMITNAKLGDQLGMNFWKAKSKYGATIQTALDYVMALDPKSEDVSDIFPHVAAVSAAYGDPKGKYAAFLSKNEFDYKSQPFYFYDQSAALPNSPAGHAKRSEEANVESGCAANLQDELAAAVATASNATDAVPPGSVVPFSCPAVFLYAPQTELDNDIFVDCNGVKRFYYVEMPAAMAVDSPGAL